MMPSPTPAEALALLKKTLEVAKDVKRPESGRAWAAIEDSREFTRFTLAGLVAELYEALERAANAYHGQPGASHPMAALEECDYPACVENLKALHATEDALMAWAKGVRG